MFTTKSETPSPDALLPALRLGDPRAFESLVAATADYLFAIAKRMLKTEAEAQDAVQEAFLQIHKSLKKFEARSSLLTWMHRIQVTTCLMKLRSKKSNPEQSIDALLPTFKSDGHQTNPNKRWHGTPEHDLAREEIRAKVRTAIDSLPDIYRTILILRDIEQLSTEETCTALGINDNVAKTRLHRARQALKTLLDPYFTGPAASHQDFLNLLLLYVI